MVKIPRLVKGTLRRTASPSARAGIIAASANVAATFARGLLPRSVLDQALVTGICSAAMYETVTWVHASAQTIALRTSDSGGMRGRTASSSRTLAADLAFIGVGLGASQALPHKTDEALGKSLVRFGAQTLMVGGAAGATVAAIDSTLSTIFPKKNLHMRPVLADVAVGGAVAAGSVFVRHQQAKKYGLVDPERRAIKRADVGATVKAVGTGVAAAGGLFILSGTEDVIAAGVDRFLDERVTRYDIGSPVLAHTVAFGVMGVAGVAGLAVVRRRIQKSGDIVEPAYPQAPESQFVTAGPNSVIAFDSIGKEGRRFVLMALKADEVEAVMGEAAIDPIRIVAGFEAAKTVEDLAQLCLEEMESLGAFDRSLICVASPTGVGYVSYTFAESLEYLTRGDCAIVMPQYALVPSALALVDTTDGVRLQRRVLELIQERIATMPADSAPQVVQFGESLGAQVALDVAYPHGAGEFARLGVAKGIYLGVPFRTKAWNAWWNAPEQFDPNRVLVKVTEPSGLFSDPTRRNAHQVMVVHDDDPVNKFTYRLIVKQPWWMGAPATRPAKVPRETIWRPITTFAITLVDLMNGMDFKPGEFRRVGHDYRIDSAPITQLVYELDATDEQMARIDQALRDREQQWAAKRLITRKFSSARDNVTRTLSSWGVKASSVELPEVADLDPASTSLDGFIARLGSSS